MTFTLTYAPGTRYAYLGSVGFPTYPDRATAERERARIVEACGDRGDIEIVETESAQDPHFVRDSGASAWENRNVQREPDRANESDSLASVSTRPKGA